MDIRRSPNQQSGVGILPIIVFGVLSLIFGFALAMALPALGVLPPQGSAQAQRTDDLFRVLMGIGGVVFFLVQGLIYYAAIAFRAKANDTSDGPNIHGNTMLEIVWTVIPSVVVVILSILAFTTWRNNTEPSATPNLINGESVAINAYGQRFAWSFEYLTNAADLNGDPIVINEGDLYTYVGQDVELEMETRDVIHSFWVPAMRVKQDLIPGRITTERFTPIDAGEGWQFVAVLNPVQLYADSDTSAEVVWEMAAPAEGEFAIPYELRVDDPNVDFAAVDWLRVTAPGGVQGWVQRADIEGRYNRYRLICTELCGGGHGEMWTELVVFENEDAFLKSWYNPTVERLSVPPDSPIALGAQVVGAYPCAGCHVLDSLGWAGASGPNLNGIADRAASRAAESGSLNGADYIAHSIRHPQDYFAPGAWAVQMPVFDPSQMPAEDLAGIVAYLCTQTGNGNPADSTCGLESWQFDGSGALVDVNALVEELTAITDLYNE